jgi:vancomycin permeability regulator SanA
MVWKGIRRFSMGGSVPRGLALFLGLFTLLNVVGELRAPGFDANLWWINLPGSWRFVEQALLLWSAACLLWFAAHQRFRPVEAIGLSVTFGALLTASIWNATSYYRLLIAGQIQSSCLIPFSVLIALCLGLIQRAVWRTDADDHAVLKKLDRPTIAITCLISGLLFPVAQMVCFGMTDYRRQADVILVFGAKIFDNGQLSWTLEERVRMGCELYHQGLADEIVFSGGPETESVHEAEGMRLRAIELGVPAAAIHVDLDGLDTESSVINMLRMAPERNWYRILAVSQFFHLPRIKLTFHRHGSEVYTIPARRLRRIPNEPYTMLREVAAWWAYYVRPLF